MDTSARNCCRAGVTTKARGNKKSAYRGRYEIAGNHIQYWDDTGFTAEGEFIDDVLHHVGMRFHRE